MIEIDCAIGEELRFGDALRVWLTGRVDAVLYVMIEASTADALEACVGFRASAPYRHGRVAHVLALRAEDRIAIGAIEIAVEATRLRLSGARALRDVRLRVRAPLAYVRTRPGRAQRRARAGVAC